MTGWRPGRAVLLIIILLAFVFPPATGYTVSSVMVDPNGALIPGTPVTATFKVGWDAGSGEPFPSENVLNLTTDLADARWTYTPLCVGPDRVPPSTPRLIDYGSYEPCLVYDSLRVTLEGKAPTVEGTTNRTIFRIHITNNSCPQGSCFSYEYTAMVINVGEASQFISEADERLRVFRSHIEENTSRGIDTSVAETKYNEADREIASARARSSTGYPDDFSDLPAALTAIDEGESALDKAWAEKSVADAQERIDRANETIGWFIGNKSTADEPLLIPIISKREMAVLSLSAANDAIAKENFTEAHERAQEGYRMANESFSEARQIQYCVPVCASPRQFFLNHWWFFSSQLLIVIVGVIGIVAVFFAGIFLWKKRK